MAKSSAVRYEVRWRVTGTEQWSDIASISPVAEIVVEGLDRTKQYDFEVRAVSACGAKSDWGTSTNTVPSAAVPLAIASLTASSLADGVHLAWDTGGVQPAGIEYSLERSTSPTTGFAERARLRGTAYTDPETSGGTFYYRVRAVNYVEVYGAYSPVVSSNGVSVSAIGTTASAAAAAAAAAQADANSALLELGNIASDNLLSQGEKPLVIRDNSVITSEQAGIDAQATAYGITTEKTAYDNAVSALTSYLATLTTPTLWSNLAGDTTIVGTTFRSNFATVYTTRQTLLNAIYAAAKAKADAAQTTANTATGQVSQLPVINGGFDMTPTGYGWGADPGSGWTIDTAGNTPGIGPNSAMHPSGAGGINVFRNGGLAACQPGQVYKTQALIKAVGANGSCYVAISWCDASGAELTTKPGTPITGTTTGGSYAIGPAPAGTVYARTILVANGHTAGTYYADNVLCTQYPSNQSEVPNGGGHNSVTAIDGNGLALIDLSQVGHVNKTADYIAESVSRKYAAESGANITETRIALQSANLNNHTQDNLNDGSTYVRSMTLSHAAGALTVDNATFQISSLAGWVAESNCGIFSQSASPTPAVGNNYLVIGTNSTVGGGFAGSTRTYSCNPGDSISVGGLIAAVSGVYSTIQMDFYTAAGAYISSVAAATSSTGWTPVAKSGVVPVNAAKMSFTLHCAAASAYACFNYVWATVNDVRVAGSGAVLGNQLNAPNSLTLNYGTVRSATSLTATSAGAVSVNAFTYYMGAGSVSYNAVSNAVTGLSVGSTYYIYTHDAGGAGGTKTWLATTNVATLLQTYDDIVVAGSVTIPSSGSSGGGGGGGGCVEVSMWLRPGLMARAARWWHRIDCFDLFDKRGKRRHRVRGNPVIQPEPCVRIVTEFGAALVCSVHTPFTDRDGDMAMAPGMAGRWVLTDGGWERVASVQHVGLRDVARIKVSGLSYAAGENPTHRIYSHNPIK